MIEVTIIDTGDWAECETPEDALCAARTMGSEARQARGTQGYDPAISFVVLGQFTYVTTLRSLNR